ncbi:MAG: ABC transporter ATP-binding protein [Candidatus Marinimicrobia bacterium]|nr:ABC transporter ATP-binding protein [Candidatus Neomarinimicrobiota bacterium]MCF7828449.1 ABC transporter ATP-binding protein [Candidatus Neomarinimicrobiota bacterium]MCF7880957.1 ABC transporter ATP-binding protein [Candidatus Neomarinimicrobiota bacterium]
MTPDYGAPAISISGLSKWYDDFRALKEIDLQIEQGQFYGLLGPNGAGKSTTIHILTGLSNFKQGDVRVFGRDVVSDFRFTRSKIGLAAQEFNFDRFFNIEKLLTLQGGYFGLPQKQAAKRAEELLNQFGLIDKRKQDSRKLSGGMKRRLQIAKALVHEPEILILDEPTAGVDVELRHMLWDYLRELNDRGVTILLTTHYIEEAEQLCEEVSIINHGEIIADGSPHDLMENMGMGCIELHLSDPVETLPESLNGYDAEIEDNYIRIRLEKPNKELQNVINGINVSELDLYEVRIRESSLEDVFVKLTGKSMSEEAANGQQ